MAAVSPPTRNARPLQGGPGIFACGCQGGITHYTLPPRGAARRAPGDTPGPRFAASAALETGLDRPAAYAPLPLFLPPFIGGRGCTPPGRQKQYVGTPKSLLLGERSNDGAVTLRRQAETMSGVHCDKRAYEGRRTGVITEAKQRLRFLADAAIHGILFVVGVCKGV